MAVNACLEREVGELEEERRRLKAHLKFNARHHNQMTLDLALTPEQLAAVDAFIADLKISDNAAKVILKGFSLPYGPPAKCQSRLVELPMVSQGCDNIGHHAWVPSCCLVVLSVLTLRLLIKEGSRGGAHKLQSYCADVPRMPLSKLKTALRPCTELFLVSFLDTFGW